MVGDKLKRGRPLTRDKSKMQVLKERRERAAYKSKHGPMEVIDPWRCKRCGAMIYYKFCIKCEADGAR